MSLRRLRAERPFGEHARLYALLYGDPSVAAALWPQGSDDRSADARAADLLADDISHWQERSFGPWVFLQAATGLFVGRGGLRSSTIAGRDCVEVLYALRSEEWGKGYASEMAALAVRHARSLGLQEVVGFVSTTNPASRRVLEKSGMHFGEVLERAGLPHWIGRLRTIV